MKRRDDFPASLVAKLAKRSAQRCSNPDCRRLTSGPHSNEDKAVIIGVAAHISAAAPGGPRYDASLNSAERASAANAIWLCQNCAKLIDSDAEKYRVDTLRDWKDRHEAWVTRHISGEELGHPASGSVELIDVSVDQESCFYSEQKIDDYRHVAPTDDFNPLSTRSSKNIFPVLDFKLRNTAQDAAYIYRLNVEILKVADLEWDKEYYYPYGIVLPSARYHIRFDRNPLETELSHDVSFSIPPHDLDRFQVQFASKQPAVYTVHLVICYNIKGIIDVGKFSFAIPGEYLGPEKIIGPTVDDKIAALRDSSDDFGRVTAAISLEKIGSTRACAHLIEALNSGSSRVRAASAAALSTCGDRSAIAPLERLAERDGKPFVRAKALRALGSLRADGSIDVLVKALNHGEEERSAASIALGFIGTTRAIQALLPIARAEADSLHVGWPALTAIGKSSHPGAFELLESLANRGRPPQAAVTALKDLRDPRSVSTFLRLLDHSDSWNRRVAADALGLLGANDAKPKLVYLFMHDPDRCVRQAAAVALARMNDCDHLKSAIANEQWCTSSIVSVISETDGAAIRALLFWICQSALEPDARVRAATALLEWGDECALSILRNELDCSESGIAAGEALGRFAVTAGIEHLRSVLRDATTSSLKTESACALARLGDAAGYETLIGMLPSRHSQMKGQDEGVPIGMVADALRLLGRFEATYTLREAWYSIQEHTRPTIWCWQYMDPIVMIEKAIEELSHPSRSGNYE